MLPSWSKTLLTKTSRTTLVTKLSTVSATQTQEYQKGNENSFKDQLNDVLKEEDYFQVHNIFTVKDMFKARVHFGHKDKALHDGMRPFVFGSRLGHIIFDLDITAYHLRKALNFCAHIAYRDGIILFISHNKRCSVMVENTAKECKEFAYTRDWRFNTLTNSTNMFLFETRLPDLCIFLNTRFETDQEHRAIIEASKVLIPTIGVVDSNCNPNLITYPIPGNDDTPSSISFFCNAFKTAILRGKEARKKNHL